ncbi:hypothetical protein GUITHDRAFT_111794 [Guillardia theta CCMP2712]|uniref:Uncharacterized protein n=1 Tax=Guillardia theta (strain CCMP2712) TaxID=905079 RepID=L1J1P9_GUITC|nr:hypothetical protein GUITHDRAFT_111794 [Guillardia theta CCMP2712]EKX42232.1 hypothetical protein GUITHDRAFT_111794 [Guillardia theta CCMP2712]|eukprot:XP_005829212.1 hypothetical protein GUITHDRAFT_111794 [Guillardia theta CCMP2712]
MKRLQQIAAFYKDELFSQWNGAHPCENIFIEKAHTPAELEHVIESRLPRLLEQHSPGLVVIDSIAAPLRGDEAYQGCQESASRSEFLIKTSRLLKHLSSRYADSPFYPRLIDIPCYSRFNCAVVTANQVTDSFSPNEDSSYTKRKQTKQAALGLTWSQGVNARLILLRPTMNDDYLIDEVEEEGNPDIAPSFQALKADKYSAGSIRPSSQAKLLWSPWAPPGICEFRIGFRGLESDEMCDNNDE